MLSNSFQLESPLFSNEIQGTAGWPMNIDSVKSNFSENHSPGLRIPINENSEIDQLRRNNANVRNPLNERNSDDNNESTYDNQNRQNQPANRQNQPANRQNQPENRQNQPANRQNQPENRQNWGKNDEDTLKILIREIQDKIRREDPYISKIKHPKLLIRALQELDNIIGMARLKESVSLQVIRLIEAINNDQAKLGMLNTVLYGKPGVGKTTVGLILAKIWYSLGFLEKNAESDDIDWAEYLEDADANKLYIYITIIGLILYYVISILVGIGGKIGWMWLLILIMIAIIIFLVVWWWYSRNEYEFIDQENVSSDNHSSESGKNPQLNNDHVNLDEDNSRKVIQVVSRADFVAQYLGQTAPKTRKLLKENLGKVLFIDEAYSLYQGPGDQYGMEALTTLNLFMSENENKIVVIFAGYKHLMQNGIFSVQPGLPRRCMWHFECDDYDGKQLAEIFLFQLKNEGLEVDDSREVIRLISEKANLFPSFGGDTKRLINYSQLASDKRRFHNSLQFSNGDNQRNVIMVDDVKKGLQFLEENNIHQGNGSSNSGSSGNGASGPAFNPDLLNSLSNLGYFSRPPAVDH